MHRSTRSYPNCGLCAVLCVLAATFARSASAEEPAAAKTPARPIVEQTAAGPVRHHNSETVKIGAIFDVQGRVGSAFDGLVDDLTVYNRALSVEEIAELAGAVEPVAWRWSPETVSTEWSTWQP